jgi:hypothetical protein
MPDAGSAIHAKSASYRLARSTRLSATTISAYDPSVRSPKLAKDRSHDWYRYNAGYSPGFVEDVLSLLEVGADALVLDPWNGSGTTTAVAQSKGVPALGYDVNPALVLIARSRLLGQEVANSIMPLVDDVVDHARLFDLDEEGIHDPLRAWFDMRAVREARGIERAIRHVLVEGGAPVGAGKERLHGVSTLAAFLYVALFDSVRSRLRAFVGSNPTWVRTASPAELLSLAPGALHDSFRDASERLTRKLRAQEPSDGVSTARVELASSSAMPLESAAARAVIASPPYCTRIDYVVATRPELAVLGLSMEEVRALRTQMIGTPTICSDVPQPVNDWGPTANALIDRVSRHTSRASGTYYRKYFLQYFASMSQSVKEVRRVLSKDGQAVIVIQDSFYKDVHVDLASVMEEMSESVGFSLQERKDFDIATTKAAINRKARSWRSTFTATESVLHFT